MYSYIILHTEIIFTILSVLAIRHYQYIGIELSLSTFA
ncbi:MAG: hypothetical protein ACI90V_001831 [Bacillariaceae sp.]|jgi:hypothetical protein